MTKPVTRVLALLELLQSNGQMSGPDLAQRLNVDTRTVRRYVATLEELGIPVTTEQGRYGGYKLVAGFKLPPMMFTQEEALAISMGLLAVGQLGLTETEPAIAAVQAKLERVMPDNLKRRVRAISNSASLVLPAVHTFRNKDDLLLLTDAAHAQQRVRFSYQADRAQPLEREVDPYGIVFRRGYWYLVGWCHLRQDLRSFRLDRLSNVRALPHSFLRPADFDAAAHLHQSMLNVPRQHPVKVILHTDVSTASCYLHGLEGLLQPQNGGLLLDTSTDSLDWFARWLVQMPCPMTVLDPPALKDSVLAHLERVRNNFS
jgi:predicted DNA-binding transcriptional regulator YafY